MPISIRLSVQVVSLSRSLPLAVPYRVGVITRRAAERRQNLAPGGASAASVTRGSRPKKMSDELNFNIEVAHATPLIASLGRTLPVSLRRIHLQDLHFDCRTRSAASSTSSSALGTRNDFPTHDLARERRRRLISSSGTEELGSL